MDKSLLVVLHRTVPTRITHSIIIIHWELAEVHLHPAAQRRIRISCCISIRVRACQICIPIQRHPLQLLPQRSQEVRLVLRRLRPPCLSSSRHRVRRSWVTVRRTFSSDLSQRVSQRMRMRRHGRRMRRTVFLRRPNDPLVHHAHHPICIHQCCIRNDMIASHRHASSSQLNLISFSLELIVPKMVDECGASYRKVNVGRLMINLILAV